MKKAIALALTLALSLGMLAGCGGGSKEPEYSGPSYAELKVGEDYTDLKAELRVITHRTDLIQEDPEKRDFTDFVKEFNALYPNIIINYEGITNYNDDMTACISSSNWGDICMVPTTVLLPDLGSYFHPLCQLSEIEADYNFATNRQYDGVVYGIPSTGNAQGIIYNKKVAEAAGYTSENLPKTPDEFLTFLQAIKDNTDAIPLYTNFAAGWTMTAWDAYIYGGATADPDWKNITMPQTKDPFADQGNGTGAYAVYKLLYDAVSMGLTEESPTATDWEDSKPMINNGEIGTMVLGSWAIIQMQEAGPNAADIGYMPFPITQPDGIGLVEDTPAPTELASLQADVNRESEMSLDADQTHVQRIVEAVITGSETFEDIIADGTPAGTAPWTVTPPASNRLLAPAPSRDGAGAERES
jgi:raffinose/stachyose/melibiose transport system substrate-binding protein